MKNQGFTFIEFLLYIALLSLVVLALEMIVLNLLRSEPRANAILEVTANGRFALLKIGAYVKEANSATISQEGNSLTLSGFKNPNQNPTIFKVLDGVLVIREGNRDYTSLTSPKVRVNFLNFQKVSNSIKIEMNISFFNPQNLPELDFSIFFSSSFPLAI